MNHAVFQMKLSLQPDHGVGWEFSDEGENLSSSFSYTVSWSPLERWDDRELILYGAQRGERIGITLTNVGNAFVSKRFGVRFSINDPMAPHDFRGLPFVRAFPYLGKKVGVLGAYGIPENAVFLPLTPLDLIRMDELYRSEGLTFVGVTSSFGPHCGAGFQRLDEKGGPWLREFDRRGPAEDSGSLGTSQVRKKAKQDDLKLIYGVGPVLERRLHALGITTFAQISRWTDKDVDEIQAKLETLPDRIRREGWVEHARRLMRPNPASPAAHRKVAGD
jgi:hypothetical protein